MSGIAEDEKWMRLALAQAHKAEAAEEVPVGAIIIRDDELIAEACNQPIGSNDASAHAEIVALRAAGEALGNYRLPGTTLYVTLEPCSMCVGAMIHARVQRVVFAASDPRTGALGGAFDLQQVGSHNHRVAVSSGVLADESAALLRGFFQKRR